MIATALPSPTVLRRRLLRVACRGVWIVIVQIVIRRSSSAIRPSDAFLHPVIPHPSSSSTTRLMVHRPAATTTRRTRTKRTTSSSWLSAAVPSIGTPTITSPTMPSNHWLHLRGGGGDHGDRDANYVNNVDGIAPSQNDDITEALLSQEEVASSTLQPESPPPLSTTTATTTTTIAATTALLLPTSVIRNAVQPFSRQYSWYLQQYPIRTKSLTAGMIFALSDLLAQVLTKSTTNGTDDPSHPDRTTTTTVVWTRVLSSAAVGLFYFGPAAHYWYSWIFRILPSTSLRSTLQKAILGQLFFGPSFTCIFFAVSLIQSGTFTMSHWWHKIRNDLPSAWMAGAGYWPIVDLISYSYVPPQYIPLFVNICSFFWTTYLAVKSYK